jgi:hypothetical protein
MVNLLKGWKLKNQGEEMVFFHLNEEIINSSNQTFFKSFSQKVSIEPIE